MRKILESVALVAVLLTWGVTVYALLGPHPLPATIPTHFDSAGNPNGFGTPAMLWLLPAIATGIFLLMTVVGRIPSAFSYPVRVAAESRALIQNAALDMVVWLKAELACMLAWLQIQIVDSARSGHATLFRWTIPAAIVAVWITVAWFIAAIRRASRR